MLNRDHGFDISNCLVIDGVAIFVGSATPSNDGGSDGDWYLQTNGAIHSKAGGVWLLKGGGTDHQSNYFSIVSGNDIAIESGKQMIVKHDFKIHAGGVLRISEGGKLCQLN
jgi:hypothetical protein